MKHNIYITGFMGTGKSVVGKVLAKKTGKIFIDMDRAIKDRQGSSIADIFSKWGETHFRKLETNLLKELMQRDDLVVATGGGTLLSGENVQLINQGSRIICLLADPMVIYQRIKESNKRPLLNKRDKLEEIKYFLEKRKAQYNQFTWQVDTSKLTVEEVADEIINILEKKDCLWKIS
ncbi:MAG: shikimate kinase [Candidatus Caldatribacteriota bacterium]|nr:shikimate kinase [Candidatus Caldatribacteriota bacterium]